MKITAIMVLPACSLRFLTGAGLHWLGLICLLLALANCAAPPPAKPINLVLFNWADDIPASVLEKFTRETGITVESRTYDTNEEDLARLRAGETIDLAVVENQEVLRLAAEGVLTRLDLSKIPNVANLSENFRNLATDPGNQFSIPYSWGTTGLIVLADQPLTSFAELLELDVKVAARDQYPDLLGMALLSLGYPANSEDPDQLQAAEARWMQMSDRLMIVGMTPEEGIAALTEGGAVVVVGWAGDVLYAREIGLEVRYVLPADGTIFWGDSYVIPAKSPHPAEAHALLDFLLRAEISAEIINQSGYPSANAAAYPLVSPEIRSDRIIFPSEADLQRILMNGEMLAPLSPAAEQRYIAAWNRIKKAIP